MFANVSHVIGWKTKFDKNKAVSGSSGRRNKEWERMLLSKWGSLLDKKITLEKEKAEQVWD